MHISIDTNHERLLAVGGDYFLTSLIPKEVKEIDPSATVEQYAPLYQADFDLILALIYVQKLRDEIRSGKVKLEFPDITGKSKEDMEQYTIAKILAEAITDSFDYLQLEKSFVLRQLLGKDVCITSDKDSANFIDIPDYRRVIALYTHRVIDTNTDTQQAFSFSLICSVMAGLNMVLLAEYQPEEDTEEFAKVLTKNFNSPFINSSEKLRDYFSEVCTPLMEEIREVLTDIAENDEFNLVAIYSAFGSFIEAVKLAIEDNHIKTKARLPMWPTPKILDLVSGKKSYKDLNVPETNTPSSKKNLAEEENYVPGIGNVSLSFSKTLWDTEINSSKDLQQLLESEEFGDSIRLIDQVKLQEINKSTVKMLILEFVVESTIRIRDAKNDEERDKTITTFKFKLINLIELLYKLSKHGLSSLSVVFGKFSDGVSEEEMFRAAKEGISNKPMTEEQFTEVVKVMLSTTTKSVIQDLGKTTPETIKEAMESQGIVEKSTDIKKTFDDLIGMRKKSTDQASSSDKKEEE